jgi:hypothetical protein
MRPRGWSLIAIVFFSGCGGGSAPIASTDVARQALRASLEAWKAGKPASSLAAEKPRIEAVDFEWKARKTLSNYEIGEVVSGQGTQTFSATLTIKGEPTAKEVRYMVLGLDPILVFRDEDFERFMNMDNAPSTPKKGRR